MSEGRTFEPARVWLLSVLHSLWLLNELKRSLRDEVNWSRRRRLKQWRLMSLTTWRCVESAQEEWIQGTSENSAKTLELNCR